MTETAGGFARQACKLLSVWVASAQGLRAVFCQIVPDVLACDQAVLDLDSVHEADAFKCSAIEPGAVQGAMTKNHGGVALPALFKLIVVLGNAGIAMLCPADQV